MSSKRRRNIDDSSTMYNHADRRDVDEMSAKCRLVPRGPNHATTHDGNFGGLRHGVVGPVGPPTPTSALAVGECPMRRRLAPRAARQRDRRAYAFGIIPTGSAQAPRRQRLRHVSMLRSTPRFPHGPCAGLQLRGRPHLAQHHPRHVFAGSRTFSRPGQARRGGSLEPVCPAVVRRTCGSRAVRRAALVR